MEEGSDLKEPLIANQFKDMETDCSICYEQIASPTKYTLHLDSSQHTVHKQCLTDYFKAMIDNNHIDKVACPIFKCQTTPTDS